MAARRIAGGAGAAACDAGDIAIVVDGAMTNGQISQLRDLSKCYMTRSDRAWYGYLVNAWDAEYHSKPFRTFGEKTLRRLTHQYRNQIRAIKRNRKRADA